MIELPEAETLRRELEREIAGKKVKGASVLVTKAVGGAQGKTRFLGALEGAKITSTERRATSFLFHTDGGATLVIDLGADGQLRKAAPKDEVHKKTAWILPFSQGGQLRLVDPSGGSTSVIGRSDALTEDVPSLAGLGIDPIDHPMSWIAFARHLLAHAGVLKTVLLDRSVVVGLGPLYTDEILFEAGLRFDREITSLNEQELRRLYRATVEVLHDAAKHRGTTLPSHPFTDLSGKPGGYQDLLQVYGKEGQLSPRSRRPIAKTTFAGNVTYYCEQSQV